MFQTKAKLIYNKKVNRNYFHCALEAASIAKNALPGQFINVKLTETFDPLLRRPFSIHRVRGKTIEILYQVVGKGSAILSEKKAGEYLDIIGPLGNGFNCLEPRVYNLKPILIAGGMGVAPLVFLAQKLFSRKPIVLIGAKTKKHILCAEEFKKIGCKIKIATDDGSKGFKGRVTELLKNVLLEPKTQFALNDSQNLKPIIYACGPKPMLKEIAVISKNYKIPAQISLEEHMACGIGACLGCMVETRTENLEPRTQFEYKRVCKDGPVFLADEIIW